MYREWKKTEFPKGNMDLGTTILRGRPRNRWQGEVGEDGRIVGGEGWQEKVRNREERKKLLWTARNRHILHVPMEWMNEHTKVMTKSWICTLILNQRRSYNLNWLISFSTIRSVKWVQPIHQVSPPPEIHTIDCNRTMAHTLYFIHSRRTLRCLTTMHQMQ